MLNNFSEKTRRLFDMWWYCYDWEDWLPDADSLHHILWRVSNSPYNACPLKNIRNHQPEWRKLLPAIHSFLVEKKYLLETASYLDSIWYEPNKKDLDFLEKYKKYYEYVKN